MPVFMYLEYVCSDCVCEYRYICKTLMKKEVMDLQKCKKGNLEGFGGKKRMGEM